MARAIPRVGMHATVEGFAGREAAMVIAVEDGGHRVVVDCGGARLAFTLRRLTGRYVREHDPYYGARLRLLPDGDDADVVDPER
jgi:hypothetical protein